MTTLVSSRIRAALHLGKYAQWFEHRAAQDFRRDLCAVAAFDTAVFPPGTQRSMFPVFDIGAYQGNPMRVQLPLESLCMIAEMAAEQADRSTERELVTRLITLGTPLRELKEAVPSTPAFSAEMQELLAADARSARFAQLGEGVAWILLWQLGEIECRTIDFSLTERIKTPRVMGEKPYGVPFASPAGDPLCAALLDLGTGANATTLTDAFQAKDGSTRWSAVEAAFGTLYRSLHERPSRDSGSARPS